MKIKMAIFFLLLLSSSANARLLLDISVTNKKGIDKGLTLVSELHAKEEIKGNEPIELKMKNGLRLRLWANFVQNFRYYGPSSTVVVSGEIYDHAGKIVKDFRNAKVIIDIGHESVIVHDKSDQLIEVKITPEVL